MIDEGTAQMIYISGLAWLVFHDTESKDTIYCIIQQMICEDMYGI